MGNIIDKKHMYELKMAAQDNLAIFDSFTKAESVLDHFCIDDVMLILNPNHNIIYIRNFCKLINKNLINDNTAFINDPECLVQQANKGYTDGFLTAKLIITDDRNIEDSYTTDHDVCFINDMTPKIYRPMFWYRNEDFRDFRELMKIMMFKG